MRDPPAPVRFETCASRRLDHSYTRYGVLSHKQNPRYTCTYVKYIFRPSLKRLQILFILIKIMSKFSAFGLSWRRNRID